MHVHNVEVINGNTVNVHFGVDREDKVDCFGVDGKEKELKLWCEAGGKRRMFGVDR